MNGQRALSRLCGTVTLVVMFSIIMASQAAPPGGKGGGGGGGSTPPPDPAIVFRNGQRELRVMNADGSNVRTLFSFRNGELVKNPGWSPDNSEIVFWAHYNGLSGIYRIPVAGGSPALVCPTLSHDPGNDWGSIGGPDWSPVPAPDGHHRIAFTQLDFATGEYDLYVVRPDGSDLVRLTSTPDRDEIGASWSPDGTRLVFRESFPQTMIVATLGADGDSLAIVAEQVVAGWHDSPAWSQTSDLIVAVTATLAGGSNIVLVDIGLPEPVTTFLTAETDQENWPAFSPDDSQLVFYRYGTIGTNGTKGGIFTMNVDGSGERLIADRNSLEPKWRRNISTARTSAATATTDAGQPCRHDLNRDGLVDVRDLAALLHDAAAPVSATDVVGLLSVWGVCR